MRHNPVNDCARVDFQSSVGGKDVEFSLWFKRQSPPVDQSHLDALAFRCGFLWSVSGKNTLGTDCVFNRVVAIDFTAGSTLSSTSSVFAGAGLLGTASPNNIALRLLEVTEPDRKSHFSGIFLYGIPKEVMSGNVLDITYVNDRVLSMTNFIVNPPLIGWRLVAVRRVSGGVELPEGITDDVTDWRAPTNIASPRRYRLIGRSSRP